jgi:hypothetical protein
MPSTGMAILLGVPDPEHIGIINLQNMANFTFNKMASHASNTKVRTSNL